MNIKKLLIFAFSLTVLTGCSSKVPDIKDRITESPGRGYEYTGVIEPLEVNAYRQGTHRIKTDDGRIVIIQSRDFDLSRYLEKPVVINGSYAEDAGGGEPVLNVTGVQFKDDSSSQELLDYENKLYGLEFEYPGDWELAETANGLTLSSDNYAWVKIVIYTDKDDLDAFAASREEGDGTPVTVSAQRSLRYLDGTTVRLYIPNPPGKKVYEIIFNEEKRDAESEKEKFYDFLDGIRLVYSGTGVRAGEKCGGEESVKCAEGYVCELENTDAGAEGVCIPVGGGKNEMDCPFIPAPSDCGDYRVAGYSKETGCPTRYECPGSGADPESEKKPDINALTGTIDKYSNQILGAQGARIIQYELTESKNLISVVYQSAGGKFKTLYSFLPSANEFNFVEKAHFQVGEDGGWELVSGTDIQNGFEKTVIEPGEAGVSATAGEGMSFYKNEYKNFSLEYPKDWYYKSFGAINNTLWTVGFADKSPDFLSDAVITVSIVDKKPDSSGYGYFITKDRDDGTFYVIAGPEDMKETIDKIAESIE
jgi:hypothetical protein